MIEKRDIHKLADLALLFVTDAEVEKLQKEIEPVLDYVSELQKFAGKEEMPKEGVVHTIMRDDGEPHESGMYTEGLLGELPQREGEYMKVKKIL